MKNRKNNEKGKKRIIILIALFFMGFGACSSCINGFTNGFSDAVNDSSSNITNVSNSVIDNDKNAIEKDEEDRKNKEEEKEEPSNNTPSIELPSVNLIAPSIIEEKHEEIDVTFSIDTEENNGKPIFTVHTNLPDKTRLMVILSNKDGLKICEEIKPENGVATTKEFTNKGNAIKDGDYDVTVLMLNSQYDSVKKIIGNKYEYLTGEYISNFDGLNIAQKTIDFKITSTITLEDEIIDYTNRVMKLNLYESKKVFVENTIYYFNCDEDIVINAIDKCNINWKEIALKKVKDLEKSGVITTLVNVRHYLEKGEFTEEEIKYVCDKMDYLPESNELIDYLESVTSSSSTSQTYITNNQYVWVTKSGKCYHSSSDCSNMKQPYQISLSKAKSENRKPCSKCY